MKGISILASLLLLVLAQYLATRMRHAGALPEKNPAAGPRSTLSQSNARPPGTAGLPRTYSL